LAALEALLAGVKVRCEVVVRVPLGRLVAKVFSPNRVDISRRLVSGALAYRRYSRGYVDAEDEARKARRGMWRGTFVKPWEWRASSRRGQASTPSNPARTRLERDFQSIGLGEGGTSACSTQAGRVDVDLRPQVRGGAPPPTRRSRSAARSKPTRGRYSLAATPPRGGGPELLSLSYGAPLGSTGMAQA
jgi:hypothetical protein